MIASPYPYGSYYRDGFCPQCGCYLYDASKTASSQTTCSRCDHLSKSHKQELKSLKKKKSRLSRMQREALYV